VHQVSSAMGKWNTKHFFYVDLRAQVDYHLCIG